MQFVESPYNDPYYNLALEEYIFNNIQEDVFMLWQNENTIVVGNYQNTVEEINAGFVKEHNIKVVRRLSGGGAVYHDLGNINYTFITEKKGQNAFQFQHFTQTIVDVLGQLGVPVEFQGRNDLVVAGKKFSGNSQYIKGNKILHHGTILFDSDLDTIGKALNVGEAKIKSKSIKSVRSRVVNLSEFMKNVTLQQFYSAIKKHILLKGGVQNYILTKEDENQILKLRDEKYSTWKWNYGYSPKYDIYKKGKCDGGTVEVLMSVDRGCIKAAAIKGDFFAGEDFYHCVEALVGLRFSEEEAGVAVDSISECIHGVEGNWLRRLIFF